MLLVPKLILQPLYFFLFSLNNIMLMLCKYHVLKLKHIYTYVCACTYMCIYIIYYIKDRPIHLISTLKQRSNIFKIKMGECFRILVAISFYIASLLLLSLWSPYTFYIRTIINSNWSRHCFHIAGNCHCRFARLSSCSPLPRHYIEKDADSHLQ